MPLDKPFEKSTKTVTFIGEDGQKLEVVSNIPKSALAILKKQGYKKESERLREQEEEALRKAEALGGEDEDDPPAEEDSPPPKKAPPTKATAR